jgi:hypothetical protein
MSAYAMNSQLARHRLLPLYYHNICAMLFICATFAVAFADLNLCSALNPISPKTLSSADDLLFALCWGQLTLCSARTAVL